MRQSIIVSDELNANENLVLKILREGGCVSFDTAMSPQALFSKCSLQGLVNQKVVEQATVSLVDKDYVEYEMNDRLETSHLWLLNELQT